MSNTPELSLPQLLNLAPYFDQPRTITEAAADLGLSVMQVRDGLDQLATLARPGLLGQQAYSVAYLDSWTAQVTPRIDALSMPMKLTPAEAATLLLTLETLETSAGLNDPNVVRSAATKLRQISWHEGTIVDTTPSQSTKAGVVELAETIQSAIRDRKVLRFDYRNANDERSVRTVDPGQIMAVEDSTYLRAADHDDPEKHAKTFRVDRIESARILDERARWIAPPQLDPLDPYGFNSDGTKNSWAHVVVDADATWVSDYDPVFWDDGATANTADAAHFGAFIPMGNIERAVSFLLRRAPSVKVVEPVSLQQAVIARARAGLEVYGYPTKSVVLPRW